MPEEFDSINDISGVPPELLARLPKQGFLLVSFSRYDMNGDIVVDLDAEKLEYDVSLFVGGERKGRTGLTGEALSELGRLFEAIWSNTSDLRGDLPARVMNTDLVLSKDGKYRVWNFPGMFEGEAEELHEALKKLVKNG